MTPDETLSREVEDELAAIERSPRDFARYMDAEFPLAYLGLSAKQADLRYRINPERFEAEIAADTEAATAAWALCRKWNLNDADLTGNERILARYWSERIRKQVNEELESAMNKYGPQHFRNAGQM